MEGQGDEIKNEIQNLIKDSCDFQMEPSSEFKKFHKAFLKFSFAALDVELNYETQSILVWNSKPSNADSLTLHNFQDAFLEKVNYTDLEETLLGCMEVGTFSDRFYKHLLYEYDRFQSNNNYKTA